MNYRNAKDLGDGRFNCEIDHPVHGWVPFTADANDVEQHGRDIHAAITAAGDATAFVPPGLDVLKASKLQALAERRYAAEEAGTTFGGSPLATDRVTQNKITAAYIKASADPDYEIQNWKFAPGVFASLNAATIIGAANAMEAHVQACFSHEATLSEQIAAAADQAVLDAVDLEAGWP